MNFIEGFNPFAINRPPPSPTAYINMKKMAIIIYTDRIKKSITDMTTNKIITDISKTDTATDLTIAAKNLNDVNTQLINNVNTQLIIKNNRSFIAATTNIIVTKKLNDISGNLNTINTNLTNLEKNIGEYKKNNNTAIYNQIGKNIDAITESVKKVNNILVGVEKFTQDKITNDYNSDSSDSNTKYLWMFLLLLLLLMIILYKYKYNKK